MFKRYRKASIADESAGYKHKMFIRTISVAARFIGRLCKPLIQAICSKDMREVSIWNRFVCIG
jgi:hypothetical protein